ncbi:MAG TPA: acyltransferase [Anaerolineaceae bacterium]|nr:acyltransferase [Anaerolineaceae bacterium]
MTISVSSQPRGSKSVKTATGFHLGYRPALDGLRGLAVLAVLAGHLKLPFSQRGAMGVDIFFALSGFLITVLLVEEWQRNHSICLIHFYKRRLLRLYPALLLMLFLVSFITPAREYIISSLFYFTNWVIALKIRPLNLELGHTWTLAIEEQYYLLWPPFLLYLLKRLPVRKVLLFPLALAALSIILRIVSWSSIHDFWRYNAGTDMHSDGLLMGSAFGLAVASGLLPKSKQFRKGLQIATLAAIASMLYVCVIDPQSDGFFAYFGVSGMAVTTLLVISQVVICPSKTLKRILEFSPLVKIGMISYGLYLWQVPILNLVNLDVLGLNSTTSLIVKVVLIFLITIFSYRYVEKPVQRLRLKLAAST